MFTNFSSNLPTEVHFYESCPSLFSGLSGPFPFDVKFISGIGIGLKFDIERKIDISIATINRKTRNQLNLNSTRIRFDVKTPVSESLGDPGAVC